MTIEIDRNCKIVRCVETGAESSTFSKPQWTALQLLLDNVNRIVSPDELANAIYTDEAILYDGVSDEAIKGVIRRVRDRIREVSDRQYVKTYSGWGWRLFLDGVI